MKTLPIKIAFLDVGHGDSIVIILPDKSQEKRAIVIDTPDYKKTIDFLEKNNVKIIEMVLISHFDSDHSKGISALIKHFNKDDRNVNRVYYSLDRISRAGDEKTNYKNLLTQLISFDKHNNIKNYSPTVDEFEKYLVQDYKNNFFLSILYPTQKELTDAHLRRNSNDTSIVLMLNYKGKKILLTGDLEGKGWASLLKRSSTYEKDIKCDVLKLPHHGGYYINKSVDEVGTSCILDKTLPTVAIVSSAQNEKFMHPQKATIDELKTRKIITICTQATEICHTDRKGIRECVLEKYGIDKKEYSSNWCPCSGDIIITIDNNIKIEPENTDTDIIKSLFDYPQCK